MPEGLPVAGARVAVLLSTFNGAAYLPEQLDSLNAQTHRDWVLYWRDDGSHDGTPHLVHGIPAGRSASVRGCPATTGHLGLTRSFMTLLRAASHDLGRADLVAFADQDDVWLPHKLERGVEALARVRDDRPALYCTRQVLVDARLNPLGLSERHRTAPAFPAALTQNIATGCTIMLNSVAARLVASSMPPDTLHDWWCYLLVSAAGGVVLLDERPSVLYRQHGRNAIGAPTSLARRASKALRRGPRPFMSTLRRHVAALLAQRDCLPAGTVTRLQTIGDALARVRALRMCGLRRRTWLETMVFRVWFLIG